LDGHEDRTWNNMLLGVGPPPAAKVESFGGELIARRSGLNRIQPRAYRACWQRREWGTNVLYRAFVPLQMLISFGAFRKA
jgi:hypothetical protein